MPDYKYLIVGGGMAAEAAVHGIREVDRNGSIGLIGAERHPPYDRPPLSKGLWKGKPLKSVWRKSEGMGVTFHLGRRAKQIDARNRGPSMPSASCSWRPVLRPAASPSAPSRSSTIAPSTTTRGCGP